MKQLVALMMCAVSLGAAAQNQNFDPDYNGDGCFTAEDFLSILTLFGNCDIEEGSTIFYFHTQPNTWPFPSSGLNWADPEGFWYLGVENDSGYIETSDFGEVLTWTIQNQDFTDPEFGYGVLSIDSVPNVNLPLEGSIPNGTINFPEGNGYYWFVIPRSIDFAFYDTPVFYSPGGNPSMLTGTEFLWNGELWDLLRPVDFAPSDQGRIFNVFCGY